ncbi:hypothetical protein DRN75_00445 [Nanoarchaeota archaeon]|nr:MAG: hypothetical protein DRN75_00445 [Nanoarchaeota archaeon]
MNHEEVESLKRERRKINREIRSVLKNIGKEENWQKVMEVKHTYIEPSLTQSTYMFYNDEDPVEKLAELVRRKEEINKKLESKKFKNGKPLKSSNVGDDKMANGNDTQLVPVGKKNAGQQQDITQPDNQQIPYKALESLLDKSPYTVLAAEALRIPGVFPYLSAIASKSGINIEAPLRTYAALAAKCLNEQGLKKVFVDPLGYLSEVDTLSKWPQAQKTLDSLLPKLHATDALEALAHWYGIMLYDMQEPEIENAGRKMAEMVG